jgi:hypothetical protein
VSLHVGSRLRRICSRNGLHLPELGRRSRSGARVEAPLATFPLAHKDPVANLKKWADALEDVDPYRLFLDSGARP